LGSLESGSAGLRAVSLVGASDFGGSAVDPSELLAFLMFRCMMTSCFCDHCIKRKSPGHRSPFFKQGPQDGDSSSHLIRCIKSDEYSKTPVDSSHGNSHASYRTSTQLGVISPECLADDDVRSLVNGNVLRDLADLRPEGGT
jgi:hypothetical protein